MPFTNSLLSLSEQDSNATLNLNDSTLDLLNAAIASHASSKPLLQPNDTLDTDKQHEAPKSTKAANGKDNKKKN